jgi:hypothetical protein
VAPDIQHDAILIPAAGVYRSDRCPRKCPRCRPPFETLLSYQLPPLAAELVR